MRGDGGVKKRKAAFQVIVLGSRGGSTEDNITGLLVRSTAAKWAKGSVLSVDAGTHLSGIIKILSETMPLTSVNKATKNTTIQTGPFAGLSVPNISAQANAAYILREMIHTVLITHAHLDHMSGFIVNTPAFQPSARAKRCAALPQTIEAIRTHIFNDVIWPNLSDEDGGVGLVTYMRLTEGGNDFLGHGDGRGYIEVAEGLGAKGWGVTHGTCRKPLGPFSGGHAHHRKASMGFPQPDGQYPSQYSRRQSHVSDPQELLQDGYVLSSSSQYPRRSSLSNRHATPQTPTHNPHYPDKDPYDSSAFFIRDHATCTEILIFGDVEPDSIALHPRNHFVWRDAAPKIAGGTLSAMFIECSFDDKVPDQYLFGHLCPRHLIAELEVLAGEVERIREKAHLSSLLPAPELMDPPSPQSHRSTKRARIDANANGASTPPTHLGSPRPAPLYSRRKTPNPGTPLLRASSSHIPIPISSIPSSPRLLSPAPRTPTGLSHSHKRTSSNLDTHYDTSDPKTVNGDENLELPSAATASPPLDGVTVYIIHVKDTYEDGPDIGDVILEELEVLGREKGLGVSFVVTAQGGSYFI